MKNRDSKKRKDKRAERQTEIDGKLPYHRVNKLEKIRRHDVPENYPRTSPPPADDAGRYSGEHFDKS